MDNNPATNEQNPKEETQTGTNSKFISQRTLILILALAGITLFFLYLAIKPQLNFKKMTQVSVSPTAIPTPYAQSVLSLVKDSNIASTANSVTYDANIDSSINKINAVQLELSFDPKVFSNISIVPGTFFNRPVPLIKNIDYKTGRISYALGIQPTDFGVKGQGTVVIITFQYNSATAPASTAVTFLPKTLVAAEGVTQSVLKSAQSVTIPLIPLQGTATQSQPKY